MIESTGKKELDNIFGITLRKNDKLFWIFETDYQATCIIVLRKNIPE